MPEARNRGERKRTVLIAEDDQATQAVLQRQLERAGYSVIACTDGRAALTMLTDMGADIIVADWLMPEMTGIELCRAVGERRAAHATSVPYFILVTAYNDKQKAVEGLEAGADDFLRKPYDFQELLARIRAGERVLCLQEELLQRQLELGKSNARLAVLNERLTKLANFDTLTGLHNRRIVLERLSDAWALAVRHDRPLSCIMIDIDHFKLVNDTHGHKAGDLVLQRIAKTLAADLRRHDLSGRFGGEEFLIVCPEGTTQGATLLAERTRAAAARQKVAAGEAIISVTVSIGVAGMRPGHTSPESLIAEADAMLYAAKQHGRNQVWYADLSGKGHLFEASAAGMEAPAAGV